MTTHKATPQSGPRIMLNGAVHQCQRASAQVLDVVLELGYPPDACGIAVALNDEVVPRKSWGATTLHADDRIEVVAATQGG